MPLSRQQKEGLLDAYKQGMAAAPNVFLVSVTGVSVPRVTELRARIRESGGQYVVVKNRIALRAIEGAALDGLKDQFVGPTAVAFSDQDPVGLAKVLTEFGKELPAFEFKGGLVEGRQVSSQQIEEIATLPSREELLSKLVYLLQSPISRFVRTLGALPRGIVTVLDQIRLSKEKGDSA